MIIIPMAGLSSRFTQAGYEKPKYMLEVNGKTLFQYSVESFAQYFDDETFLYIYRDIQDTKAFIHSQVKKMKIKNAIFSCLESPTKGQAETVYLGLEHLNISQNTALTIFNIDTFRPNLTKPTNIPPTSKGYLEVFIGQGNNWSFIEPLNPESNRVKRTTEKDPISNLCCTGLYHFNSYSLFKQAYECNQNKFIKGELYIAPMYNSLIEQGLEIHYSLIDRDEVIFCGTPQEFEEFKSKSK